MIDLKHAAKEDPLKKNAVKPEGMEEMSPMDPPDAFEPPNMEKVDPSTLHPLLQELIAEHRPLEESLKSFDDALTSIQEEGVTKDVDTKVKEFFRFFDEHFIKHNRREERQLFPLLRKKMLMSGEHSQGIDQTTAVEVLEDDHVKAHQQLAVVFNFLSLAFRLKDAGSRLVVLDLAIQQGRNLVEEVRLHIFREENVVFPMANKLLTKAEMDLLVLQ